MLLLIQAYLPEGALVFGYHSIYSTPWAPSAKIEEDHFHLTKVTNIHDFDAIDVIFIRDVLLPLGKGNKAFMR